MTANLTREALLAVLDEIRSGVASGDTLEGSIQFTLNCDEPPAAHPYDAQAAYRVGNLQGQGGMRLIGHASPTAPARRDDTLDTPPRQGPCERCHQDRPVFDAPEGVTPKLLCARCWSAYKEARDNGTFLDCDDAFDHATDEQLAEGLSGGAR
jgi:hypothetical protein